MKNRSIALLLCLPLLLCGGCWDYQEINSLSIVAGAALDRGADGKPMITAELADLQSQKDSVTPHLLTGTGESYLAAGMNAAGQTGRKLYYGHAQSIIVSKEIAEDDMVPVLDFISRQNDMRLSLRLLVSREDSAAAVLHTKPSTEQLGSFELSLRATEQGRDGPAMPFYQFYSEVKEPGIDPFLPAVSVESGDDEAATQLDGAALFQGTRLRGFLDEQQTQTLLLLRNLSSSGLITVPRSDAQGGDVTFSIDSYHTSMRPVIQGDTVRCSLRLRMEVMVGELEGDQGVLSKEAQQQLSQLCSGQVQQQVEALLQDLQTKYGCDTLGVGLSINRYHPHQWEQWSDTWRQRFPQVEFDVQVDTTVTGTGRMYMPVDRATN